MHREATFSRDDLDGLSVSALASLNHAFRREGSNRPQRRDHVRMQRERDAKRRFVDTRGRKWRLDDR